MGDKYCNSTKPEFQCSAGMGGCDVKDDCEPGLECKELTNDLKLYGYDFRGVVRGLGWKYCVHGRSKVLFFKVLLNCFEKNKFELSSVIELRLEINSWLNWNIYGRSDFNIAYILSYEMFVDNI